MYSWDFLLDEGRGNHRVIAHYPSVLSHVIVRRRARSIPVKHLKSLVANASTGAVISTGAMFLQVN
jgi:hypothetical protein